MYILARKPITRIVQDNFIVCQFIRLNLLKMHTFVGICS